MPITPFNGQPAPGTDYSHSGLGGPIGSPPSGPAMPLDLSQLIYDPQTGFYRKPGGTELYQVGGDGQLTQVTNPSSTALIAKADKTADFYNARATADAAGLATTMSGQRGLADTYRATISDPNAPSVARQQLLQALEAADATQASGAAGASGANAFIARRNAANNMATLGAKEGQAAAGLRAQEVATAQRGLADVYGQLGNEGTTQYGANAGLGLGYMGQATGNRTAGDANATARRGQNIGLATSAIGGASAGLSGALAPVPGGAPAVAAGFTGQGDDLLPLGR